MREVDAWLHREALLIIPYELRQTLLSLSVDKGVAGAFVEMRFLREDVALIIVLLLSDWRLGDAQTAPVIQPKHLLLSRSVVCITSASE
jgi:hypothetical protein